jgi:hypothetical protein
MHKEKTARGIKKFAQPEIRAPGRGWRATNSQDLVLARQPGPNRWSLQSSDQWWSTADRGAWTSQQLVVVRWLQADAWHYLNYPFIFEFFKVFY